MNTSRYVLGASLIFWGWQTGILWISVLMAVALEAAHWVKLRWDFSEADLNRIFDLCTVLFVGAGAYCFISRDTSNDVMSFFRAGSYTEKGQAASQAINSAFIFIQWWPMILFPLAAAQAYGTQPYIPFTTLSWILRRRAAQGHAVPGGLNIGPLYLTVVLATSSSTLHQGNWFYLGFSVLAAWALWGIRPKRFSIVIWICFMLAVIKLGFWTHEGLHALQSYLDMKVPSITAWFASKPSDKHESGTGIGEIGKIKTSGKIVLRVDPEGDKVPQLLRDSSYNRYSGAKGQWDIARQELKDVVGDVGSDWKLLPEKKTTDAVVISQYLVSGAAYLAVPNGTAELQNLPVANLKTNSYGVLKAENGPGFIEYRTLYGPGVTIDSAVVPNDLSVEVKEKPALDRIIDELDLRKKSEPTRIAALELFFQKKFEYSTYLKIKNPGPDGTNSAIGEFLLNHRIGHCEYFATATVLLLREMGIAARYVNGYSVQEKERGSTRYLVRRRHAHAWCLYFSEVDHVWHDLDTTAASWLAEESKDTPFWEPLSDLWDNLWYKFSRWRWLGERIATEKYIGVTLVVLVSYLSWRLFGKKRGVRRTGSGSGDSSALGWPGLDSEFYLVETRLGELGLGRYPGETLIVWLHRLESTPTLPIQPLRAALNLHYRYRFDPQGISDAERESLREKVRVWLDEVREWQPEPERSTVGTAR